jgi:hypothetical protein
LRLAQRDIDLRPERYTNYYKEEFPARFRDQMDTRRWGPRERIVFEPYTREAFEEMRSLQGDHFQKHRMILVVVASYRKCGTICSLNTFM